MLYFVQYRPNNALQGTVQPLLRSVWPAPELTR